MPTNVVLVSGCSSGFGLHAAVYLAQQGLRVVATMRDLGKRERFERAAAQAGVTVDIERLDVTDDASIHRCVTATLARHSRIDGLVNNAGFGTGGFAYDMSLGEIRAQIETNFFGLVALTKAVLPSMVEQRAGRIVNISSIAGRVAMPLVAAYSASKFAVEGFSEALRYELLPFGIEVTLIQPGSFRTDIFDRETRMTTGGRDDRSPFFTLSSALERRLTKMIERFPTDLSPISRAIHRALVAKRPPFRQIVGHDARLQAIAKALLPHRMLDMAVTRVIAGRATRASHTPR